MGDQGVQQMQQPIVVYPTRQYPDPSSSSSQPSSSSGSKGSFVTVFIVLAVIFVLSVIACAFGRLCNRRMRVAKQQRSSQHTMHDKASSKKSREIRPVEGETRERGDMEFGFDMKRPVEHEPRERSDMEFGFDMKRPVERQPRERGDMEFGFDMKRPVEREPRERSDMEFGFDMKRPELIEEPSGRDGEDDIEFGFGNKRGERRGGGSPPPSIKHGVRFKLPENGNHHHAKGEIRYGGPDYELRPEE